ncbi:uncharacterized protein LOC114841416 [Diachasma alloeum]|uniref:Odorant receptor n=1 Tax=Diachasma alloeum TaxID=454923 RepID=A0A4E0RZ35_9HYME|nr:uncharacterized protein LOC114841416 [Diachasma alloeum]THK33141.1 odorant receptor 164 [Diachasma alloeum]
MKTGDIFSDGYYKRNRIFMVLIGLWPEYPKRPRIFVQCLALLSLVSAMIPQYAFLIKVCDNMDDVIFAFVDQMTVSVALVYYYVFIKNMEWIHLTINQIREDWRILEKSSALETLQTYAKRGYLATTFYTWVIFTTGICFSLLPLKPVALDIILPLNESRPRTNVLKVDHSIYGIDKDKYYFTISFHGIMNVVLLLNFIVAVDTFIIILIEHCCGLFEAVGDILRQMQADISPEHQHEILCDAIGVHHRALTLADSIESTFTMMYGFIVLVSMILVSLTGIEIILKLGDPAELIRFALYGGAQIMHLLFVSIPGQEIYDHSSRVLEETYISKLIYIMLMRSIKPMHLTAGGFYILCLQSFGNVLKTSFSFFTVLLSSR